MKYLVERGKKFNEIAVGYHFLQYVGKMYFKTPFYTTSWKSDGRIMIVSQFLKLLLINRMELPLIR